MMMVYDADNDFVELIHRQQYSPGLFLPGIQARKQLEKGTACLSISGFKENFSIFNKKNKKYSCFRAVGYGSSGDFIRRPGVSTDVSKYSPMSYEVRMASKQGLHNLTLSSIKDDGTWVDLIFSALYTIPKDAELLLPLCAHIAKMNLDNDALQGVWKLLQCRYYQ